MLIRTVIGALLVELLFLILPVHGIHGISSKRACCVRRLCRPSRALFIGHLSVSHRFSASKDNDLDHFGRTMRLMEDGPNKDLNTLDGDHTHGSSEIDTLNPSPNSIYGVGDVENDKQVLVFSDFVDLYRDLHSTSAPAGASLDSAKSFFDSDAVVAENSIESSQHEHSFSPSHPDRPSEEPNSFDSAKYSLARRQFVKRLFKKLPQITDTKLFLVRSKGCVKGRIRSKVDLSVFDSNRVSTKPAPGSEASGPSHALRSKRKSHGRAKTQRCAPLELEPPFASIESVLPGLFTGLHTLKHTKKRIIRELKVKLDLYVKTLSSQLRRVLDFYSQLVRYIHPFQYNLFRTTVHDLFATGEAKIGFEQLLVRLSEAKKQLVARGKAVNSQLASTATSKLIKDFHSSAPSGSPTTVGSTAGSTPKTQMFVRPPAITRCRDAFDFVKVSIFQLDELYSGFQTLYDQYAQYHNALAKLPVIDIEKPILAIVGLVNIGKTTLYNRIAERIVGIRTIEPTALDPSVVPESVSGPFPSTEADLPGRSVADNTTASGADPITNSPADAQHPATAPTNGSLAGFNRPNSSSVELAGSSLGLLWSNIPCSSAKRAKVADYKFTTRGINRCTLTYRLDNFLFEGQLLDTPGLLWRSSPTKLNPYERLTYSVLKDLPCGVLFCFDTTSSMDDQVNLYKSLRSRFPHRPWLNVMVKGDGQLHDLGDEVVRPEECCNRINSMFTRLHDILNL